MTEKLGSINALPSHHFSMNKEPKCPHCGSDFDIGENEAWFLYNDDDIHEVECPQCDLPFKVVSHSSWVFSTDEQED